MHSPEYTPLRKARLARGLSQTEVSRKIGITDSHLSRLELGRRVATTYVAADLARFYAPELNELHIFYPERYQDWTPKSYRSDTGDRTDLAL